MRLSSNMRLSAFIRVHLRPVYSVLLAFTLLAQQTQPPQQAPQNADAAKFTSSTQLVVEMVTVKDKAGNIVEGLSAKDFTVTEDGKPQTISFCEFQKLEGGAAVVPGAVPAAAQPAVPDVPPSTRFQIAPAPPGDIRYRDRPLRGLHFEISA